MRVALSVSTVGHVAIIGWGLIALPDIDPYEPSSQPLVPVDIISIEEFTEITAGTRAGDEKLEPTPPKPVEEAKPVEQPKPEPKPEALPAVAPTPVLAPAPLPKPEPVELQTAALTPDDPAPTPALRPEPAPEPNLRPEPAPVEQALPQPEPEPQPLANAPVPRVKPKITVKPKPVSLPPSEPAAEPQQFDANDIAALLNKITDAGGGSPTDDGMIAPALGAASGTEANLSLNEIDALRAQIVQCWNPPVAVVDAGGLLVRIGLELNLDGTLSAPPTILNSSADPIFTVAAEAAIRAVNRCQPYFLPPEKYSSWRQIHMNFDPRKLVGG